MKDTTKREASTLHVAVLLHAVILLLTSVIAAPLGEKDAHERLIVASFADVVPTVGRDIAVDAFVRHEGDAFQMRIAEGATHAFGVSASIFAYSVDEELYRVTLWNGERREPLHVVRVVAVAWKPSSHLYAEVAQTPEAMIVIVADADSGSWYRANR